MYLPCTHSSLRFQLQAGPASLPTGQTDFNFRIRTNAPGEIELTATVDASGAVAESDEGNNDAQSTDLNVIQVMCRIQPWGCCGGKVALSSRVLSRPATSLSVVRASTDPTPRFAPPFAAPGAGGPATRVVVMLIASCVPCAHGRLRRTSSRPASPPTRWGSPPPRPSTSPSSSPTRAASPGSRPPGRTRSRSRSPRAQWLTGMLGEVVDDERGGGGWGDRLGEGEKGWFSMHPGLGTAACLCVCLASLRAQRYVGYAPRTDG